MYDSEKQLFVLNFRGLSFEFHIESKFEVSTYRPGFECREIHTYVDSIETDLEFHFSPLHADQIWDVLIYDLV